MANEILTPVFNEPVKRQKNGVWKVTDTTMIEFMNALYDASEENRRQGFTATAENQIKLKMLLYGVLDEVGFFDDVRE